MRKFESANTDLLDGKFQSFSQVPANGFRVTGNWRLVSGGG
jgi:hypothetical protein